MNFIDAYIEYCQEQTDAPAVFHKILSYVVLSSVVGKNVSMEFGFKRLYTNLYVLLVAPSSAYRKSWSMGIARNLIEMLRPNFFIQDCSSRESFISEFGQEERLAIGGIEIDELAGFIHRVKTNHHFAGFLQDLASAYDGRTITRRKGVSEKEKETFVVKEPFLNIMAACSNDWLNRSMETSDITGGGFARFLWTVCDGRISNPWPEPKPHSESKLGVLVFKLQTIGSYIGDAKFDEQAAAHFAEWYRDYRSINQGGKWDQSYERLATVAKKLSILNCLARSEEEGIPPSETSFSINLSDVGRATLWVEGAITYFDKIAVGDSQQEVIKNRVLLFIKKHAPVNRSKILRNLSSIDSWHLSNALTNLLEADQIKSEKRLARNNIETDYFSPITD